MAEDVNVKVNATGADKAAADLNEVGKAAGKIGDSVGQSANKFEQATNKSDSLLASMIKLDTAKFALRTLIDLGKQLVDVLDESNTKAVELVDRLVSANKTVTGAAAQFNVSDDVMRQELSNIGITAGSNDLGALSSLSIALSSTGQIGQMSNGAFAAKDRQRIANIQTWLERTGAGSAADSVASALARMRPYMPDSTDTELLGILETAYKQAEATDWSDFLGGMIPMYGQMAQGYEPVQAISEYASLAKYTKSGTAAGETMRLVSDQIIFSGNKKLIEQFDTYMEEPGAYERLLKNNRAALSSNVQSMFARVSDLDRLRLYDRAGVGQEGRTRMNNLLAGRMTAAAIREAFSGSDAAVANQDWLGGSTARIQSAEMATTLIAMEDASEMSPFAAAAKIADAEREHMAATNPIAKNLTEFFNIGQADEQAAFLRRRVQRVLDRHGVRRRDVIKSIPQTGNEQVGYMPQFAYRWLISGGLGPNSNMDFDFIDDAELQSDLRRAAGQPSMTINGGTHYHNHGQADQSARQQPMEGVDQ